MQLFYKMLLRYQSLKKDPYLEIKLEVRHFGTLQRLTFERNKRPLTHIIDTLTHTLWDLSCLSISSCLEATQEINEVHGVIGL